MYIREGKGCLHIYCKQQIIDCQRQVGRSLWAPLLAAFAALLIKKEI